MAKSSNNYSTVDSPLFLLPFLLLFIVTSAILTAAQWPPPMEALSPSLLTGFIEIEGLSATLSTLLSLAAISFTAAIIYRLNIELFNCGKNSYKVSLIYLIYLFSSPVALHFYGTTIAAPLLLLSLYYTLKSDNSPTTLFLAAFTISLASLFEFTLAPLLLFILYHSLTKSSFSLKSLTLFLISAALPFIVLLSIRYLLFNDSLLLLRIYLDANLALLTKPQLHFQTVAGLLSTLFFILYIGVAIVAIKRREKRYKIIKSNALNRTIGLALLLSLLLLFNNGWGERYLSLLVIPLSYITAEHLSLKGKKGRGRALFLILLTLLLVGRISSFI